MNTTAYTRSAIIPPPRQLLNTGTQLGDTVILSSHTANEGPLIASSGIRNIFIGRQPIYDRALAAAWRKA